MKCILMTSSDKYMHKDLVTVTIEKALFEIGSPVYDAIVLALQNTYQSTIPDCYKHPEYLKNVLEQYFGSASNAVVHSINNDLRNAAKNTTIEKFLSVLNK